MYLRSFIIVVLFLSVQVAIYSQVQTDDSLASRVSSLEKTMGKLSNFQVSGYIQAQYQNGQEESLSLKVGDPVNEKPGEESINRMGIRRGRIKLTYEESIYRGVFQVDMTEKAITVKDVYFQVKDPWTKKSYVRAGVYNRPFGYEVSYSSSLRESPERAAVNQLLFPDERDLGLGVFLQPKTTSPLHFMSLQAGIFAGNGIRVDSDNRKDFIGHLSANRSIGKNIQWGLGVSYYQGSVWNPTGKLYVMNNVGFQPELVNPGSYVRREYMGLDGQLAWKTSWGKTQLRGEYLWGIQPGTALSSRSPNYPSRAVWEAEVTAKDGDGLYKRNFQGYYIHLIQDLGKSPFKLTVKYDSYDPNTKINASQVDVAGSHSSFADLAVETWGVGAICDVSKSFRLMAYYEINQNEVAVNATSAHNTLYNHERRDNVLTLRLQYKY